MEINTPLVLSTALIPMLLGFIWYHPAVFGKAWMAATGLTEEDLSKGKMAVIFGVAFLFSLMLATFMPGIVIHQFGLFSILMDQPGMNDTPITNPDWNRMMAKHGHNFRTFKHGVFHGVITGVFLVLPVLGIPALFERKGFKYMAINVGYWLVCLGLMGGIICQFA